MDPIQLQHEPAQSTCFQFEKASVIALDLFRGMRLTSDFLA